MKKVMYYIYHIPLKKIGVTRNLNKRVTISQGYSPDEYEVLDQSEDISYISRKEKELQFIYGYKVDYNSFKSLNKQTRKMKINTTEQTTTFPVPVKDIESYLNNNKGFKWASSQGKHELDTDTIYWIVKNIRVSHYDPTRSYVYNKALVVGTETEKIDREFKESRTVATTKVEPSIYDLIRIWAKDKGIYDKGDSKTQYVKLMEEAGELARGILKRDEPEIKDAIGDMIVVLTNLARLEGLKIEDCIESAYNVIKDRKGKMDNGTFKKETL
jgi:NTP pyrophosphatase (non-canonical NTP hydrolase)